MENFQLLLLLSFSGIIYLLMYRLEYHTQKAWTRDICEVKYHVFHKDPETWTIQSFPVASSARCELMRWYRMDTNVDLTTVQLGKTYECYTHKNCELFSLVDRSVTKLPFNERITILLYVVGILVTSGVFLCAAHT